LCALLSYVIPNTGTGHEKRPVNKCRTALGPTQPPVQWESGAPSMGVKWLGHKADHSLSSSAKVKNVWNYSSIPPYFFIAWCLIMQKDNFTLPDLTL